MSGIVIIPAYNPDEKLEEIVDDLWELGYRVIVVNDGSSKSSDKIFDAVADVADVLNHSVNQGKGAAIKTALRYLKNCDIPQETIIATMDADGQHDPIDVQNVITYAHTTRGEALVLGVRTIGKAMPLKSRVGNWMTKTVFHIVTGKEISDTQTGLRAFGLPLLDFMLQVPGERYEYESNVLLQTVKHQISVKEVPIRTIYRNRENSSSHFRAIFDSIRIYKDIIKFTLCSISSFLIDFLLFGLFTILFPKTEEAVLFANIAARVMSAGYNYYMNTTKVFNERPTRKKATEYAVLAFGILVANSAVLSLYMEAEIPKYIAKILTELTLFAISFLVQKFIIYRGAEKKVYVEKKEEF